MSCTVNILKSFSFNLKSFKSFLSFLQSGKKNQKQLIIKNGDTKHVFSTDSKLSFHTEYFSVWRELSCNLKTYLNCISVKSSVTLWGYSCIKLCMEVTERAWVKNVNASRQTLLSSGPSIPHYSSSETSPVFVVWLKKYPTQVSLEDTAEVVWPSTESIRQGMSCFLFVRHSRCGCNSTSFFQRQLFTQHDLKCLGPVVSCTNQEP